MRALYGSSYRMSASRMDKLRSCHFGYFMQYGLCAKERAAAGFDAPEIGTFLHYLLENVNREVKARGGYGAVERAALRGLVRQYLEKYSEEQLGGCREKSARFRYLFSRLRTTAYAIVENVADELSQSVRAGLRRKGRAAPGHHHPRGGEYPRRHRQGRPRGRLAQGRKALYPRGGL